MSYIKTEVIKNSDGSITFNTSQEVGDILDQNVREANSSINRTSRDTFGTKVASIPLNVLNQWCKEWNCTMTQLMSDKTLKVKLFQRLNSKDFLKLRTDHGRL